MRGWMLTGLRRRPGPAAGTLVAAVVAATLAVAAFGVAGANPPSPLGRLAGADVVMAADNQLRVTTGAGEDRQQESAPLPAYRGVPARLASELTRVPGVAAAAGLTGFPEGAVGPGLVDVIAVTADRGTSAATLAARIRADLHGAAGYSIATGAGRAELADPNLAIEVANGHALGEAVIPMLITTALFALAATTALSVDLRRRRLALLRAVGATRGQVRRAVLAEQALLAVAGGAIGFLPGTALGTLGVRALAAHGLLPAGSTAASSPWFALLGIGLDLVVGLLSALVAAQRAARTSPARAVRATHAERARPNPGPGPARPGRRRWRGGAQRALAPPERPGSAGRAGPAVAHAAAGQSAQTVAAGHVLSGSGLSEAALARARSLPGVRAAVGIAPLQVGVTDPDPEFLGGEAVSAGPLSAVLSLGVVRGELAALRPGQIALSSLEAAGGAMSARPGERVTVYLPDGTPYHATVSAIYQRSLAFGDLLLPAGVAAGHTGTPAGYSQILVSGGTARELAALAASYPGTRLADRTVYNAEVARNTEQNSFINLVILGVIAALTAVTMVNTLVVSTLERRRQVRLLTRIGATRGQLAAGFAGQAAFVTVVGVAAGAAVCAGTLIGLTRAVTGSAVPYIPAGSAVLLVSAVAALAVAAIMIPFALTSGRPGGPPAA